MVWLGRAAAAAAAAATAAGGSACRKLSDEGINAIRTHFYLYFPDQGDIVTVQLPMQLCKKINLMFLSTVSSCMHLPSVMNHDRSDTPLAEHAGREGFSERLNSAMGACLWCCTCIGLLACLLPHL